MNLKRCFIAALLCSLCSTATADTDTLATSNCINRRVTCLSEVRAPLGAACYRLPAIDRTKLRTYRNGMTRSTFQYAYTAEQEMVLVVSNACNGSETKKTYRDIRVATQTWYWQADQGSIEHLWEQVDDFISPKSLNACPTTPPATE